MSAVDWRAYRRLVDELACGKRLPSAVYVHREADACRTGALGALVSRLADTHAIGDEFNVIKFRTDAPRLSFLSYPGFHERAHPALAQTIAIDLQTGKLFRTDYSDNLNPPILHRKELLLPPDHPRLSEYRALSEEEEANGLYRDTAIIGFRLNWERLLTERGVAIDGHTLRRLDGSASAAASLPMPTVHRHKTALTRYTLSKPVKTLVEYGQLTAGRTFFDYGCGLGADVRGLRALGHDATGWDPVHQGDSEKREADIVNLGYVLNVIEDPAERVGTLVDAWRLARKLLVVSAMVRGAPADAASVEFQDGVLTRRGTFQKYFDQQELQQYLEDSLDRVAIPVSLGIFYVFRETSDQQLFLQARSHRSIDWDSISLGFERPEPRAARVRVPRVDLFEVHAELLEQFWEACLEVGRLPLPLEFARWQELSELFGSPKRALAGLLRRGRRAAFEALQAARKNDLLVYLASASLRKKLAFAQLPGGAREDIRNFFGTYARGLAEGRQLLHAAADPTTVALACDDSSVGWQDSGGLYVDSALVERLSPVLRAYVACAEVLYGDARQADIVKIHKTSGKVSFLTYTGFRQRQLPELATRTKVNLRTLTVDIFDHTGHGELLYFKDRFLAVEDPERLRLQPIGEALRQLGVSEKDFLGPNLSQLKVLLAGSGRQLMKTLVPAVVEAEAP